MFDGVFRTISDALEFYEVLLGAVKTHLTPETFEKLAKADVPAIETFVDGVLGDFGTELLKRPSLRKDLAQCAIGYLATEKFMDGMDFSLAMNQARDEVQDKLSSVHYTLVVLPLTYRAKKKALIEAVKAIQFPPALKALMEGDGPEHPGQLIDLAQWGLAIARQLLAVLADTQPAV